MSAAFQYAANIDDIKPGEKKLVQLGDIRILLINLEGTFYALDAICTHSSVTLSRGQIRDGNVVCPLHNSEFDIKTGAVTCPPAMKDLTVYQVKLQGEAVLVRGPEE